MKPEGSDLTFDGANLLIRLVPEGGLEPPRAEARQILSLVRLPIPPLRLEMEVQYSRGG